MKLRNIFHLFLLMLATFLVEAANAQTFSVIPPFTV